MTRHELKVHNQFWPALLSGAKLFELRRNDRGYKVGDQLCLCEYYPDFGFSGSRMIVAVSYVLLPEDCPGLMPGFAILGISHELS